MDKQSVALPGAIGEGITHMALPSIYPRWTAGMHCHRLYEVEILLEGQGEFVSMPAQTIVPGTVLYHSPHAPHNWRENLRSIHDIDTGRHGNACVVMFCDGRVAIFYSQDQSITLDPWHAE